MPPKNRLAKINSAAAEQRMAAAVSEVAHVAIPVPPDILAVYRAEAERLGMPVERVMAARLINCHDHTASKPLYFNDEERTTLERALDYNFNSARQVNERVGRLLTPLVMDVEGEPLPLVLTAPQIDRLKSRCFHKYPLKQKILDIVVRALNMETGMF